MAAGTNNPSIDVTSTPTEVATLHAGELVHDLPLPENKRFYPALNGIRAIAVLMVFYEHYLPGWKPALRWGWTGVDIFFVLSGFLITGILYDTRNASYRFRTFYARRTLRIFPLYYGVLLVALALTPIFHWVWHPVQLLWPLYLSNYGRFIWLSDWHKGIGTIDHLRSSLSHPRDFLLYFGHFWSLCVEEQFYLVWPPIVFLIKDRVRLRNLCIVICVLCLVARVICVWLVPQPYLDAELLYRLTPLRADTLLFGSLLALMLRGPESLWLSKIAKPALYVFLLGFALFEVIYVLCVHHAYRVFSVHGPILSTLGFTLIYIFAGLIILYSLDPSTKLYRFLTIKPLLRLGQMSYGFYIFHEIPHIAYMLVVLRLFGNLPVLTFELIVGSIALCMTILLSYLSFRFFESPFLRLKDRFTL